MKTQPLLQLSRIIRITALMLALIVALSPSRVAASELPAVGISIAPPRHRNILPPRALPFTVQDFVLFISETFLIQPIESEADYAKFIYSERERDGRDVEIMRIRIQERESHLQVAFSFKEFNVMHYVAEFMEGPFFTHAESEQLYALLYAPAGQHSWKRVGRFQSRVTLLSGADGMEALFEFTGSSSGTQR